jgi:hypothetical protein
MASVRSEALTLDYGVNAIGLHRACASSRRNEYRRKNHLNVVIGSHQAAGHRFIPKRDKRHGGAAPPLVKPPQRRQLFGDPSC